MVTHLSITAYLLSGLMSLLRFIIELLVELNKKIEKLSPNDHNTKMEAKQNDKER